MVAACMGFMNSDEGKNMMQIALTKKFAAALDLKPQSARKAVNPLFCWTANWVKVWDNRRANDMLVLVNNATRFTVAVYEFKRRDLKNTAEIIKKAIANTFLYANINPEIVEEYMRSAGEIEFTENHNRSASAWVTKAGQYSADRVAYDYNGVDKMFCDTMGAFVNNIPVNRSTDNCFFPREKMIAELCALTGKQAYKYRAFELSVTLDLKIYKAVRKIIVPASLEFERLHKVLQEIFNWRNRHLYRFTVFGSNGKPAVELVPFNEDLDYAENEILMRGHILSEILPKHKKMLYTYDFGDRWEHEIKLVRVIEDYDKPSPYLSEASGQTPPEDVGGVSGFLDFREIMMNPDHPDYQETNEWVRYWSPELSKWDTNPREIRDY